MLRPILKISIRNGSRSFSTAKNIVNECHTLRKSIQQLNDKCRGPLASNTQKNTVMPFVFLLGNHSSGKSSFVNYILQRKVQSSGVAPTDDAFTVIAPGPQDVDRDGPSFIGDPDMGFGALKNFGPTLIHHTQLKIRNDTAVNDFMIVDTPGMIDSPGGFHNGAYNDRGYDFEKVCRWYAEKADVILLFFDPDKPGTTGETLKVLTNSLSGLDHKLHIILNKADQFEKIHDFARAYGSLCWNLSKVIHRKDLPRIYTMCLPHKLDSQKPLGKSLIDLETTREEVVNEVLNAPKRRVNNEVSRLYDSVSLLQMHCKIVDDLVRQYKQKKHKLYGLTTLTASVGVGLPVGEFYLNMPVELIVSNAVFGVLSTLGVGWYTSHSLRDAARNLVSDTGLTSSYKRLYNHEIHENDESISSLWERVEKHLTNSLTMADLASLNRVKTSEFKLLNNMISVDIKELRRKVAPMLSTKTNE